MTEAVVRAPRRTSTSRSEKSCSDRPQGPGRGTSERGRSHPRKGRGKAGRPRSRFRHPHEERRLRGCIGYTEAVAPLFKVVQECAVAAATEDPRFPPVSSNELPSLRVEISVLTPLVPIRPRMSRSAGTD